MSDGFRRNGFVKEMSNLIFFWIYGVIFFFLFRVIFVLMFHEELGDNLSVMEYVRTFIMGYRFDSVATSYFIVVPLVATYVLSPSGKFELIRKIRIVCQYLFLVLSAIICVVTLNYYKEYNEQFNNFVFLALYDDRKAVLKTIIEYYNPLLNIFVIGVIITAGIFVWKYFEKKQAIYNVLLKLKANYLRVICGLLFPILFIAAIRGSFTSYNASKKWAFVSTDEFLNKTIINPYKSLIYSYDAYRKYTNINKDNPFGKENFCEVYGTDSLSDLIKKEAKGEVIEKPKQIFLVIMESYDSWPLLEKYRSFGIADNLCRIADNGTHFTNFLPTFNATFFAYSTITTSMPYCGFNLSELALVSEPYISSMYNQFEELGYKTNLFYGGFISWNNIGKFSKHIGCSKVYSGADAGGKSDSGDWGVEDEKIFDLVLERIDPEEYTFNVILTSSYHGPYSVDIEAKGFMYDEEKDLPEEARQYYGRGMNFREMGHLWYGDWAIGRFMEEAEQKYDNAVFAFTGDHYGRRFVNHTPNLYERSAVPFILYGKDIPAQKLNTPGSHIDIIPTMIEMVAPAGFEYYSFGKSLFDGDKKYGVGFEKIITENELYYFPKDGQSKVIDLATLEESEADLVQYAEDYGELMRLGWHYIVYGNDLKEDEIVK